MYAVWMPTDDRPPWGSIDSRVTSDGSVHYRLRGYVEGEPATVGTFDSREAALERAASIHAQLAAAGKGRTVSGWGDIWLNRRELAGRHRSIKDTRKAWNRYVEGTRLAAMTLRAVRPEHVRQWVHDLEGQTATCGKFRGTPLSEHTIRNAVTALSAAIEAAIAAGEYKQTNPCLGIKVRKVARVDDPWTHMSPDEIRTVHDHVPASGHLRGSWTRAQAIFVVAIYTGLREGELWGLQWEDVNLEKATVRVRHGSGELGPCKSGKPRTVPLLPPAVEALRAWHAESIVRCKRKLVRSRGEVDVHRGVVTDIRTRKEVMRGYVFPGERGPMKRGADAQWAGHWEGKGEKRHFVPGWRERLGLRSDIRFHDLRHTCAVHLISGSWGHAWRLEDVQQVLGHRSRTTTERYARFAPDALAGVAEKARLAWAPPVHDMSTAK